MLSNGTFRKARFMKKRMWIISAVLAVSLFAGCSGKQSVEQDGTETVIQTITPTITPTATPTEATGKKIAPSPAELSVDRLDNCTIAVAFSSQDITEETDGTVKIHFEVYDYETFAATDIDELQEGDTLLIDGQNIPVISVEREDTAVRINGGVENGGINLVTDENGMYYENLTDTADIVYSYYLVGDTTMVTDPTFVCEDSADLDLGQQIYTAGQLKEKEEFRCTAADSTMRIENGKIKKVTRSYRP